MSLRGSEKVPPDKVPKHKDVAAKAKDARTAAPSFRPPAAPRSQSVASFVAPARPPPARSESVAFRAPQQRRHSGPRPPARSSSVAPGPTQAQRSRPLGVPESQAPHHRLPRSCSVAVPAHSRAPLPATPSRAVYNRSASLRAPMPKPRPRTTGGAPPATPGKTRTAEVARAPQDWGAWDELEMELVQWRYINHTFEHAKGQQLQTALDQLYALLQDAEQQQHQRHAAALAAHSAAVQRLLADALRDACLGTDAVSAFGTAHAELARAVAGSCNRMPLDGVHVADEGALAQELQRSAEVLRRLQDAAAPVRDPVLRLCRAVEELGDAQGRVAEGLQGLFGALAAQRARTERECSVLVGRIQGLEAQVRAACPGASDPLGGDGPSPAPPPTA